MNIIDKEEQIPPAIIHTIVENGITHSIPNAENQVKMVLSFEKNGEGKQYQLATFAQNRKPKGKKGGTGFKYIRSRLRENYGDRWQLSSGATDYGWLTTIYLY